MDKAVETQMSRNALLAGWPSFKIACEALFSADRLDEFIGARAKKHQQSIAAQFTHLRRRLFGDGHRNPNERLELPPLPPLRPIFGSVAEYRMELEREREFSTNSTK